MPVQISPEALLWVASMSKGRSFSVDCCIVTCQKERCSKLLKFMLAGNLEVASIRLKTSSISGGSVLIIIVMLRF